MFVVDKFQIACEAETRDLVIHSWEMYNLLHKHHFLEIYQRLCLIAISLCRSWDCHTFGPSNVGEVEFTRQKYIKALSQSFECFFLYLYEAFLKFVIILEASTAPYNVHIITSSYFGCTMSVSQTAFECDSSVNAMTSQHTNTYTHIFTF